jgi:hypothetical protein
MVRPDRSAESSTGIFQPHALVGGMVNSGPPHTWFTNVGAGAPIPGNAPAFRSSELHLGEAVEEGFSNQDREHLLRHASVPLALRGINLTRQHRLYPRNARCEDGTVRANTSVHRSCIRDAAGQKDGALRHYEKQCRRSLCGRGAVQHVSVYSVKLGYATTFGASVVGNGDSNGNCD